MTGAALFPACLLFDIFRTDFIELGAKAAIGFCHPHYTAGISLIPAGHLIVATCRSGSACRFDLRNEAARFTFETASIGVLLNFLT